MQFADLEKFMGEAATILPVSTRGTPCGHRKSFERKISTLLRSGMGEEDK